jgi:anthranilate synthase component I
VADGTAHVQTGAGIVADSEPEIELAETKAKAAALLPAVLGSELGTTTTRR